MKRYKYTKLMKLGPVDGFMIHTPDDRKLKDVYPQTIVRELNRLNVEMDEKRKDIVYLATEKEKLEERIKRLEAVVNDPHALWTNWLRGDVKLPVGIGDVRQYQDRIKRLEEAGDDLYANCDPSRWDSTATAARKLSDQNDWRKAKEDKL